MGHMSVECKKKNILNEFSSIKCYENFTLVSNFFNYLLLLPTTKLYFKKNLPKFKSRVTTSLNDVLYIYMFLYTLFYYLILFFFAFD